MEPNLWLQIFNDYVLPALVTLFAAACTYLITVLGNWIKGQLPSGAVKTAEMVERLLKVVQVAVTATMQELGDGLKEAAKDGKLTDEEKMRLKQTAIEKVKNMGGDLLVEAKSFIPDVDALVSDLIEFVVRSLKKK